MHCYYYIEKQKIYKIAYKINQNYSTHYISHKAIIFGMESLFLTFITYDITFKLPKMIFKNCCGISDSMSADAKAPTTNIPINQTGNTGKCMFSFQVKP